MDLVEAPDPVLAYFCKYFWLHEVPIADSAQVTQFVNTHRSIQKFYVGNDVVRNLPTINSSVID